MALLLGSGMVVILLGLAVMLHDGAPPIHHGTAPAAVPTTDPRLIIHARTVPLAGVLAPGVRIRGTLYPAYPGRNTLRLVLQRHGRARGGGVSLALVVTMPGMAMAPIRVHLRGHDDRYSCAITLPMFGTYRARITVVTPDGPATGTITLPLAWPAT